MTSDDPGVPDLDLIAAYRGGDAGAFDRIFARYHVRIRSICMRYVGDGPVAEDLVQETFYNVLRTIERVEEGFNFSAWIHRIAVNLCHDELRRRERNSSHVEQASLDADDAVLQVADQKRSNHPEGALESTQLRALVWEVAKRLPERQRMVLTLRELQGLSYASIAHVMGISQSAVETLLHRARRRFKEEYLLLEGSADGSGEGDCATAAYLLENSRQRSLRKDQRRTVAEHLAGCRVCSARFPEKAAMLSALVDVDGGPGAEAGRTARHARPAGRNGAPPHAGPLSRRLGRQPAVGTVTLQAE